MSTETEYLKDYIRCALSDLDERDVESHIWYNRFLVIIETIEINHKKLNDENRTK